MIGRAHSVRVGAACLVALVSVLGCQRGTPEARPSKHARDVAAYAVATYADDAVEMLSDLVAFKTFHPPKLDYSVNPEFVAMRDYLRARANEFGFDFTDHGPLVVIGLGESSERVGVVAHGDVQPADAGKWTHDPFSLDAESEPGRLVGRGTEDDKGPLVNALYAMKSLADRQLPMARRVELLVAWTEEWDWDPIRELLKTWEPPQINIAFDAMYPVVVAEKGWGQVEVAFLGDLEVSGDGPLLESIVGGSFLSQVPEDAAAVIARPTEALENALKRRAESDEDVGFDFERQDGRLIVRSRGVSAHSSTPEHGRNALTHLAALLDSVAWPPSPAAHFVRFANDLVGTGDLAERFGDLAYSHPFMGPLTLTLATAKPNDDGDLTAGISFRRPQGRSREEIESIVETTLEDWTAASKIAASWEATVYDPYSALDAPQVPVLLEVFRHYTGIDDAQPVAMGGGTNASLLPNGVSFGPSMPGMVYSGHTEHEFITRDQFRLDLEMYTAALAELVTE